MARTGPRLNIDERCGSFSEVDAVHWVGEKSIERIVDLQESIDRSGHGAT